MIFSFTILHSDIYLGEAVGINNFFEDSVVTVLVVAFFYSQIIGSVRNTLRANQESERITNYV